MTIGKRTLAKSRMAAGLSPLPLSVWVGNIPEAWTEPAIRETFKKFGEITRVDLPSGRSSRKPFAFVHFAKPEEAALALAQGDTMKVGDRTLSIRTNTGPQRSAMLSDRHRSEPQRQLRPDYDDFRHGPVPRHEPLPRKGDFPDDSYERLRHPEEPYRPRRKYDDPCEDYPEDPRYRRVEDPRYGRPGDRPLPPRH